MYDGRPHERGTARYTYNPSIDAVSGATASRTNSYIMPITAPATHTTMTAVRICFVYCFKPANVFFIFLPIFDNVIDISVSGSRRQVFVAYYP